MGMTRKHYRWLATEIAPITTNKELFITKVKEIAGRNFDQYRFRDAVEDAWADAQADECGPDLYKQVDYKEN
jgi:hypothetical protein